MNLSSGLTDQYLMAAICGSAIIMLLGVGFQGFAVGLDAATIVADDMVLQNCKCDLLHNILSGLLILLTGIGK